MIRNIIGFLVGLVAGSLLNGALIKIGHAVIPLPAGADVSSYDALKAAMPLFGPEQFIFVFLAHALGSLAGAFAAAAIAASHKMKLALGVGAMFLIGGLINAFLLPVPLWYDAVDLILAYIPMAWIGGRLAGAARPS